MTYKNAQIIIGLQNKKINALNGEKFTIGNYEYRFMIKSGFYIYVGLDRREVGRRRYKFYGGFNGTGYINATQVIDAAIEYVNAKEAANC